jgi:hypothetical protein
MTFMRNHKLNIHKYNIIIRAKLNVHLDNEIEYTKLSWYRNFLREKKTNSVHKPTGPRNIGHPKFRILGDFL